MALYGQIFEDDPLIRVPDVVPELSTERLLTMTWLDGRRLTRLQGPRRKRIATPSPRAMFRAWWYPVLATTASSTATRIWATTPCSRTARRAADAPGSGDPGINLLDYGCIRTFPPSFVQGVIDLYRGLQRGDRDLIVHAYETWGFKGLSNELIDILNIWARFIYGPLLDDRVRTHRRGHDARRVRPQGSVQGAPGAEGEGAR